MRQIITVREGQVLLCWTWRGPSRIADSPVSTRQMNGIMVGRSRPGREDTTTGGGPESPGCSPCEGTVEENVYHLPLGGAHTSDGVWAPVDFVLLGGYGWGMWLFPGFMAALSGLLGAFLLGGVPGCTKKSSVSTQLLPEGAVSCSLSLPSLLFLSHSLSLKHGLCLPL